METTIQRYHARSLRRNMTSAEIKLWSHLRCRKLQGHRFNRLVEIGSYIVDFLCRERKLIVEVDGATHGDVDELRRDERRREYLEAHGFTLLRIGNMEVYENSYGVLSAIVEALEKSESQFKHRNR